MSVDAELAGFRGRLLLGRGVGASATEVEHHTKNRDALGGKLTVLELQQVQQQTQLARGEAPTPTTIAPPASWPEAEPEAERNVLAAVLGVLALGMALRRALPWGRASRRPVRRDRRA